MKRMIRYDQVLDEKNPCGGGGFAPRVDRAMPDIEDLPRYLPPCLKAVIGTNLHLKDQDRLTVVKYIVDMGYSEEDMLRSLAKGENDVKTLRSQYSWATRRRAKAYPGRISLNCGGVININTDDGNTVRCLYEARCTKKGDRKRRDYDLVEKDGFKSQCAASLKISTERGEYLNHPIDYVKHKLNK